MKAIPMRTCAWVYIEIYDLRDNRSRWSSSDSIMLLRRSSLDAELQLIPKHAPIVKLRIHDRKLHRLKLLRSFSLSFNSTYLSFTTVASFLRK